MGEEVTFDKEGRPIQRGIGFSYEKANEHNKGVTADTDILTAAVSPTNPPCTFRIFFCVDDAGVFSAIITKAASTKQVKLNESIDLTADCGYAFDILVHGGDTVNFQHSVDTTLHVLRVQEIGSE